MNIIKSTLLLCVCVTLAACQSMPEYRGAKDVPPAAPKNLKIGKAYTIKGKTYYPSYNPSYNETGIASWYGPGFHGKKTASGETYDQYAMTAAHPTLPMPSLVRVTNLKNGQSTVVRINDRGPFAAGRIIDLSQRAAETIGIKGIEKVRVEYLKDETEQYWANSNIKTKYASTPRPPQSPPTQYAEYQDNGDNATTGEPAPIMSVNSTQVIDLKQSPKDGKMVAHKVPTYDISNDPPPPNQPDKWQAKPWQTPRESLAVDTKPPDHTNSKRYSASIDPPVPRSGYFIQAGAFSVKSNANRMLGKLAHTGRAFIDHLERGRSTLYRVRLGPYNSHGEASDFLHELFKLGIKDAAIVSVR